MEYLALNLPGFTDSISNTPGNRFSGPESTSLGYVASQFGIIALYVGGVMVFFWLVWGVFQYIIAEGNKEKLAHARARIRWALIGFMILALAFFISDYVKGFLRPGEVNITPVSDPQQRINEGVR